MLLEDVSSCLENQLTSKRFGGLVRRTLAPRISSRAAKIQHEAGMVSSTERTGETGIEFGNLRIVHKLISL